MSTVDVKGINEAYFNACNFESLMRGTGLWLPNLPILTYGLRNPFHCFLDGAIKNLYVFYLLTLQTVLTKTQLRALSVVHRPNIL